MKLVAVLAAAAAATAVEATGLVGTTCSYGTTAPPLPPVDCELYTLISDPSPWGACALDTASGKYVRTKVLGIKTPAANGGKACPAEDDPSRRVQEVCQPIDCVPLAPADDTGPFGPCKDDGTGAWYKSKVLGIKEPAKNGGKCDEKDRTIKELCKGVPCVVNLPTEDTGNFSDCRINPANPTQWIKTKTLGIKTPAENGGSCPSEAERQYSEVCPGEKCIPLTPEEDTGPYGECTKDATTGKWVKSKVLGIKTPAKYGGSCDEKDRTFTQPCAAIDCVWFTPEEDKGPFGNCTDDGTGKWYKSKVLGIKTPAQYGGTECVPEDQRTVKELCPAENCIAVDPADDTKPFGPCTDDGTGKWYKSKVLDVKVPAKNGGSCDEKDRTVSQLCEPVPCVVNLPSEDTGNFTPCALDTASYGVRYIKTKILGIKTPALNGGTCPTEAERKYMEVCPPENCIPLTPEEDTGPYGECTKDATTGKWVKSKILGIRVEAKYGGTCDEKNRTFTQPCAAIDCVWFTPEEDKGPFGNCTDDGTGKWYKSKVLGIKTPAQYGGTECVPEDQRTVKELCPAENCIAVDPADDTKPFGNCTDDGTGKWYKSKLLDIKVPAKNGGSCDEKNRTVSQFCEPVPCVVNLPSEDTGDFTPCALDPETYGVRYIKTKILGIKTPAQNGGTCPSEAERKYTEVCPPVNCVPLTPEEDKGPFGNCTDDGTGKYYKSKVLGIKVPAQNGGLCDEKNRTITEFCPPVDCVALDPKDDTKPFGNCTNDGTGKYYKSKVLGIKTPAQNGGTCDEKKRTITEFCPPKNCVALSPAEDKGPFGNCTQEGYSAKYYKSKTLGIKYPAENGGTCDPADRLYKVLCDPINCVVKTPAEDNGEFGDCKKASDGKYYKSKVLGIKVPAQYGGTCPSEKERTITKECLNDGYCLPWDPFYDTCLVKLAQCGAKKNGVVYVGSTINVVKGLALWECCDKCTLTAGCVAYTYIPFGNAAKSECWLKWDVDVKLPVYDNTVSSSTLAPRPRQCSYFDDRTLASFTSKTLAKYDSDDLDFCCTKCKANTKCKAFTVSDDTCYLESEEGVRVWWPGTRAGWTRLV